MMSKRKSSKENKNTIMIFSEGDIIKYFISTWIPLSILHEIRFFHSHPCKSSIFNLYQIGKTKKTYQQLLENICMCLFCRFEQWFSHHYKPFDHQNRRACIFLHHHNRLHIQFWRFPNGYYHMETNQQHSFCL